MLKEDFEKLIQDLIKLPAETECVEFKVNCFIPKEIGKRISALSNAANLHDKKKSYMVFGIEDKTHMIVGTKYRPDSEIVNGNPLKFWLAQNLDPRIDFYIWEREVDGKHLVLFEIPPAVGKPTHFDDVAYIRIGSATPKLKDHPDKEIKLWANINQASFEKGIAKEHCNISNVLELLDYSKYLELTKQEVPTHTSEIVSKLTRHGMVKKVFDDNYDITNLGALLFAKDLTVFPTIRRKAVRVVVYEGKDSTVIKKQNTGTRGYAVGWEPLINYINDQLPSNEDISRTLRKEVRMYPEIAIREFVANALIHQDLSVSGTGPLIEIYADRVEITNAGIPFVEIDRIIDSPARSRNEDLAAFMREVGVCEELGTGIDRALTEIAFYQLPAPIFEKFETNMRVVILDKRSLKDMTVNDRVRACFHHCVLLHVKRGRMTNATLRKRLNIEDDKYTSASGIIKETVKRGLIKESDKPREYVPIWA